MNTLANGKITDIRELKKIAKKIRINILHMLTRAGSVHTGGSLSAADVSVAIYFSKMKFDPANPKWEERDRFIMSKGHAAPLIHEDVEATLKRHRVDVRVLGEGGGQISAISEQLRQRHDADRERSHLPCLA